VARVVAHIRKGLNFVVQLLGADASIFHFIFFDAKKNPADLSIYGVQG
jgi:hypothetical protein